MTLNDQLTVGNLIIINLVTMAPVILILGRGVWYLSQMAHKVDQMWDAFQGENSHIFPTRRHATKEH